MVFPYLGPANGWVTETPEILEAIGSTIAIAKTLFLDLIGYIDDFKSILEILPLPATWTALLIAMLTVIVVLRIYSFVKDIEILGFKI